MHEAAKAHHCNCERSWEDIDFEDVSLQDDDRLALAHRCDEHRNEQCVHILPRKTVDMIRRALGAK